MKVSDLPISKAELAKALGVSGAAVSQWEEVPLKRREAVEAYLKKRDLLEGIKELYGSGSKYDGQYSRSKIEFMRGLLKSHKGDVDAVFRYVQPVQFDREFIMDVKANRVEPRGKEPGRLCRNLDCIWCGGRHVGPCKPFMFDENKEARERVRQAYEEKVSAEEVQGIEAEKET